MDDRKWPFPSERNPYQTVGDIIEERDALRAKLAVAERMAQMLFEWGRDAEALLAEWEELK